MVTPNPDFIYKVASGEVFRASEAAGTFLGMPIDHADGYVQFSQATQLRDTLRLHFAGQSDLTLFAVRTEALGERLRWEPSRGGQLFPHVFGVVPMAAIAHCSSIAVGADGTVALPGWVQ